MTIEVVGIPFNHGSSRLLYTLIKQIKTLWLRPSGMSVVADESLDDGSLLRGITHPPLSLLDALSGPPCMSSEGMAGLAAEGLAALVVKPSVIGSVEAVERLVKWSRGVTTSRGATGDGHGSSTRVGTTDALDP